MTHPADYMAEALRGDSELAKEFVRYAQMTEPKPCDNCGGDGYTTCCGVGCTEPGWPDSDICAGCYEHTGDSCDSCNGTGEIKP